MTPRRRQHKTTLGFEVGAWPFLASYLRMERSNRSIMGVQSEFVDSVKLAASFIQRAAPGLHDAPIEVLGFVGLDLQKRVVGLTTIAEGGLHGVDVHPREVFRRAFLIPCASFMLFHNHPSGDPQPSEADVAFTHKVREIGHVVGIPLSDHLIMTADPAVYYSFTESRR